MGSSGSSLAFLPHAGVLVAVALVVRVVAVWALGVDVADPGDGEAYLQAARYLRDGRYPLTQPITRPPLYPLFVAPWLSLPSLAMTFAAIRLSQVAIDVATCVLAARLAFRLAGDVVPGGATGRGVVRWGLTGRGMAAVVAFLLFAVNPHFVLQCWRIQTETLYMALLVGALTLLQGAEEQAGQGALWTGARWAGARRFVGAGAVLGLAALCRPQTQLVVVALIGLMVLLRRARGALWVGVGVVMVVGPFTVRNWVDWGEPVTVTDGFHFSLWLGNNDELARKLRATTREEFERIDREVYFERLPRMWAETEGFSPRQREAYWKAQFLRDSQALEGQRVGFYAAKLAAFFRPTVSPLIHGVKAAVALFVMPGLMLMVGVVGFFVLARATPMLAAYTLAMGATSVFMALAFQPNMRFRCPMLDPLLLLYAALLVTLWVVRGRQPTLAEGLRDGR